MIVSPNPILAGNNNRTPKLTTEIDTLNLCPKKANWSIIDMGGLE
jgi:hypothetical protein